VSYSPIFFSQRPLFNAWYIKQIKIQLQEKRGAYFRPSSIFNILLTLLW